MPEEPTTPNGVELLRRCVEATNRRDIDEVMSMYAPDAVWDNSPAGVGTFEGLDAIRGFIEDWMGAYEEFEVEVEEGRDLGNGVTFVILTQRGRLAGSSGEVQVRNGGVGLSADNLVMRITTYTDVDEARAAAERLAKERG